MSKDIEGQLSFLDEEDAFLDAEENRYVCHLSKKDDWQKKIAGKYEEGYRIKHLQHIDNNYVRVVMENSLIPTGKPVGLHDSPE